MLNRKAVVVPSVFAGLSLSAAPAPATLESLETRQMMSTAQAIGINVNDGTSNGVAHSASTLKSLGVTTVRIWASISNYNDHQLTGGLKAATYWADQGFNVDLEVSPKNGTMPSTSAVTGFFKWAMSNSTLKNAVDEWEIGNEPDGKSYWKGTLSQYVNNYLTPAYNVLHPAGETVISAGPSWNPQDVQTMINAGLLNVTDYVGFHPYAKGASGVEKSIAAIDDVVDGRKPIAATEWSIRGVSDHTEWAKEVAEAYPAVKAGTALNYYFCQKVMDSMAGPGGIFNADWSHNTPFYNAFATFQDDNGGLNTGYTYGQSTGGSSSGNTPAGSGSISGTLFNDDDGDGKFDSDESVTGARQVYIDANGNGRLDSGEKTTTSSSSGKYTFSGLGKGTYKVSRVFPSGYKLSNNDTGYVNATVASGQKISGVNLGTEASSTTNTGSPTSSTAKPTITGIALIDAVTGDTIASYTKSATVKLSSLPKTGVAIAATVGKNVDSVKMTGLGRTSLENVAPYTILNDTDSGDYGAWVATKGSQTFSATAYTGESGTGTKSSTTTVTLTFA